MFVRPCVIPMLFLLVAEGAQAASCGASVELTGPMPRDPRNLTLTNIQTKQWGYLVTSSLRTHKLPLAFVLSNPYGRQTYSFKFSENVTRIRLSLGSELLYEGPPLAACSAEGKPSAALALEFEWEGKDVRVAVDDDCGAGSPYNFGQPQRPKS
ncbi:MAG: hypothetical protein HYZ17_09945 [Betaproteobacteria bacterium]|nr:hypothetical protein [Betaproteobacteria bacterium]